MVSSGGRAWLLWGGGGGMAALGECVWLLPWGACVVAPGGHVWLLWGHAWLLPRGVCMVAPEGCVWLLLGACMVALGGDIRGI